MILAGLEAQFGCGTVEPVKNEGTPLRGASSTALNEVALPSGIKLLRDSLMYIVDPQTLD